MEYIWVLEIDEILVCFGIGEVLGIIEMVCSLESLGAQKLGRVE